VRSLDNIAGDAASNYFNRTHGALVYGWGGRSPRVLWHTDNLNAITEDTCSALTAQGALATPEEFKQLLLDTMWVSPENAHQARLYLQAGNRVSRPGLRPQLPRPV